MAFDQSKWIGTRILVGGAGIFFLGAMLLWVAASGTLFVSPDETANAHFIQQFAQTGQMRWFDPLNTELADTVHPRSTVARDGWVMPTGFLGLATLYGIVVRLLGAWVMPLLTPLIALAAVFAWRRLAARWFGESIGTLSALVLLFHPAFWYYSARGLMPNVLFTSLLLLAAYLWFERPWKPSVSAWISGCLLGFALFVRASEVYWVAMSVCVLVAINWRTLPKRDVAWLFLGSVVGVAPFFVMNALTYGHPLVTGYTLPPASSTPTDPIVTSANTEPWLFPFGVAPRAFLRHVFEYGVVLFWWLSLPAALGWVVTWFRNVHASSQASREQKIYLGLFVGVAIWLGVWYGSWVIHDNPDPTQVTLANSYVRYWLPVFVLSTPFVALGLVWIQERLKHRVLPWILVAMTGMSLYATFFTGQDGLMDVARVLRRSQGIQQELNQLVEPEALIVVDRADKLFFPHRVTYPLRSDQTYDLMPRAVQMVPVYYYGITLPERDLTYLNERKLKERGLRIEWIQTFDEESLYRIEPS